MDLGKHHLRLFKGRVCYLCSNYCTKQLIPELFQHFKMTHFTFNYIQRLNKFIFCLIYTKDFVLLSLCAMDRLDELKHNSCVMFKALCSIAVMLDLSFWCFLLPPLFPISGNSMLCSSMLHLLSVPVSSPAPLHSLTPWLFGLGKSTHLQESPQGQLKCPHIVHVHLNLGCTIYCGGGRNENKTLLKNILQYYYNISHFNILFITILINFSSFSNK